VKRFRYITNVVQEIVDMKLYLQFFFIIICSFFISIEGVLAIGADPEPRKIVQADGTSIVIKIIGDEWFHYTTTLDDYRIIKNAKGIYEYVTVLKSGKIIPSGFKANSASERGMGEQNYLKNSSKLLGINENSYLKAREKYFPSSKLKSLSTSTGFPKIGNKKLLVILANFSDKDTIYSKVQFNNLMNQTGYNSIGSFKDYYEENSKAKLSISSVTTKWVKLNKTHDYYGNSIGEFIYDAIVAANNQGVNFSEFDNDSDGAVEGVIVVHQGRGQEVTDNPSDIWSHAYSLSSYGYSVAQRTIGGLVFDNYVTVPELNSFSTEMTTVGVVCHEFGHLLGLPDYYDTNGDVYGYFDGTGKWDLMAVGAYNGVKKGESPSHMNGHSKIELGWASAQTIAIPSPQTLAPVETNGQLLKYYTTSPSEYYLLENRIKAGFDAALPGEGLIIYHVDQAFIDAKRGSNIVNVGTHLGLYIKAAGGIINSSNCSFPGTLSKTDFTDFSFPSSLAWDGSSTNKSVTNIIQLANDITFDFMSLQDGAPLSFSVASPDYQSVQLNWLSAVENYPVLLVYNTTNTFGIPVNGTTYSAGQTIPSGGGTVLYAGSNLSFLHSGLTEKTKYYYRLWCDRGTTYSVPLSTSVGTLAAPVSSFPWIDDFETGLSNWRQQSVSGSLTWSINTGGSESKNPALAHSGTSNALLYSSQKMVTKLISPVFNATAGQAMRLEFCHAQAKWINDQDELRVYYKKVGDITWTELANYQSDVDDWRKRILDFIATGNFEIAFEGAANYGHGVVLDDVKLLFQPCTAPTNLPSNGILVDKSKTSLSIGWDQGDGTRSLVVCRKGIETLGIPESGSSYTANTVFGLGSELISGEYVVYDGIGNSVVVSNLTVGTRYAFSVFTYNNSDNCYQPVPYLVSFYTEFDSVDITVILKDKNATPVVSADVWVDGVKGITDVNGEVVIRLVSGFSTYVPIVVKANGFENKYFRIIPDKSESIALELDVFEATKPVITSALSNGKNITLKWNPVINENFSSYAPFSLSMPNWTMVDVDGGVTYGLFGASVSFPNEGYTGSYIVMDGYDSSLLQNNIEIGAYANRQFLGCASSKIAPNSDWLISPEIEISSSTWLSFMAKSYTSDYGLERIKVLISENGTDINQFTTISNGSYIEVPVSWTQCKYDLSSYLGKKIHFAIKCVSSDAYLLMLDLIRITPDDPGNGQLSAFMPVLKSSAVKEQIVNGSLMKLKNTMVQSVPVTYEVYRGVDLVGSNDGLSPLSFNDVVSGCQAYSYQVSAVYSSPIVSSLSDASVVNSCYQVKITVLNGASPVIGATVTFNSVILTSDANGEVVYNNIDGGTIGSLKVTKTGFNDYNQSFTVNSATNINAQLSLATQLPLPDSNILSVTPNPSSGKFKVALPLGSSNCNYFIYGLTGNLIRKDFSATANFVLDITDFSNGIYLLNLEFNGIQKVVKLKKQ